MPAILEKFGINKLSNDEKLELIDAIEESMIDDEIPDWHWEILKERIAEADANPGTGIPLDEVLANWATKS